jgi:hypothetical protein
MSDQSSGPAIMPIDYSQRAIIAAARTALQHAIEHHDAISRGRDWYLAKGELFAHLLKLFTDFDACRGKELDSLMSEIQRLVALLPGPSILLTEAERVRFGIPVVGQFELSRP